jgi:hypothetical protein
MRDQPLPDFATTFSDVESVLGGGFRVTSEPIEQRHRPGQITPIAWIYVVFGLALLVACFANAQIGQFRLSAIDAWFPGLLIVAAVGAILRRPWGRWSCYLFSALMLAGVPLGTILGGLMIYNLTVHRDQFRRSPHEHVAP